MPAPPKTSDERIVTAARRLVERRGAAAVSMAAVAEAVGVRAPSLYGRFASRARLLAAVELAIWRDLGLALSRAGRTMGPVRALTAQARAYRKFAKAHPRAYALIHAAGAERTAAGVEARMAAAAHALRPLTALVGEAHALPAARVLTPFLHGFVSMELAGAFRLGGGIDAAFENGVATIIAGIRAHHS